jgi:hypothetical protein
MHTKLSKATERAITLPVGLKPEVMKIPYFFMENISGYG